MPDKNVYQERILVSPKAVRIARVILKWQAEERLHPISFRASDDDFFHYTGLKPNTVFLALDELQRHGALTFTRPGERGLRSFVIDPTSWVWAAVQTGAES